MAALPDEVGVTAPVGVPVFEASLAAMEEAADAAASGLLFVLSKTLSMRWTTPLERYSKENGGLNIRLW